MCVVACWTLRARGITRGGERDEPFAAAAAATERDRTLLTTTNGPPGSLYEINVRQGTGALIPFFPSLYICLSLSLSLTRARWNSKLIAVRVRAVYNPPGAPHFILITLYNYYCARNQSQMQFVCEFIYIYIYFEGEKQKLYTNIFAKVYIVFDKKIVVNIIE